MRCFNTNLTWSAFVALSVLPNVASSQAALASVFRPLLDSEYVATVRGDTSSLGAHLADDLVWTVGMNGTTMGKKQLLAAAAHAGTPAPRFMVDSLRATRFGDVATVEYRRNDHWPMGSGESVTSWRALDVFALHQGRWLLERHTQVWIVSPVIAVAHDSAAMNAFVGHYQIGPGYVDNVHWEGQALVATASGQSAGARLVPVSTDAFSPDGIGVVIVFERDGNGQVIDYVQAYPDGRVIRAKRLENAESDSGSTAVAVRRAIEPLLADQMLAANAHDTDRFLAAYLHQPTLVFAIDGVVMTGWDTVRATQLKWWNNGKSDVKYQYTGTPTFTVLGPEAAVVTLTIASSRVLPSGETRTGELAVTTVWQKRREGWRAVQVHESSLKPAAK